MSERIAELLHTLTCNKFHSTGECPWYDEAATLEEWEMPVHLEYLAMAENEMKIDGMSESDVINVLTTIMKLNFNGAMTRKLVVKFLEIAIKSAT